jgi:signal transduction histidine kinase
MNEKVRLLLVEDDRIDQMAFRRMIEQTQLPYDYVIAGSTAEAFSALGEAKFDLILTDYLLSDGTAFDIIDGITDTPVIFITGMGDEEVAVRAMKGGAYDYLIKDEKRAYLNVLPPVVANVIKRRTAELEAEEMIRERVRREMLEDFIHDVSHDLRTPLSTLGISLHLLGKYIRQLDTLIDEPSGVQELIAKIQERFDLTVGFHQQLEQIILDMLEMVKLDNQTLIQAAEHDLNMLAEKLIRSQMSSAAAKSQELYFEPFDEPLLFHANAEEFNSILRNLVRNAINYTPDGGTIIVETGQNDFEVILTVRDTGAGIPADELGNIFRRFYRVNKARTMDASGAGLGLAIAKRLVELHRGRIEVESVEGQGSTFRVFLPRLYK